MLLLNVVVCTKQWSADCFAFYIGFNYDNNVIKTRRKKSFRRFMHMGRKMAEKRLKCGKVY
jgi:hypothetical protein